MVRIIRQGGGGRIQANTTLLLQGAAFDDAGRQLTGSHLKWFAAETPIGRGALVTARGLPTGTERIRLVATDSHGCTGQASFVVSVLAVRPALLVARAPADVPTSARHVRITVASTVPAVLTIAGVHHRVDRTPERSR